MGSGLSVKVLPPFVLVRFREDGAIDAYNSGCDAIKLAKVADVVAEMCAEALRGKVKKAMPREP